MTLCPYYKEKVTFEKSKRCDTGRQPQKPTINRAWICSKKGSTWIPSIGETNVPCNGDIHKCIIQTAQ